MLSNETGTEEYKAIFDLLITKAIELQKPPKHKSLLHSLSPCHDPDLLSYAVPRLIDCGVKIESKNKSKYTPLREAIERNNPFLVKELLKENCSLTYVSCENQNLLQMVRSNLHPKHPVELCVYLSKVEAVKLKMYFGPNARPSLYEEGDIVGNIVSITFSLADLHTKFSAAQPPMGPNSFVFTYIFTEKYPHQRSTPPKTGLCPPYGKSWTRPWLLSVQYKFLSSSCNLCIILSFISIIMQKIH